MLSVQQPLNWKFSRDAAAAGLFDETAVKYCVFDTETRGLEPGCGVVEFAAAVYDWQYNLQESYTTLIRPEDGLAGPTHIHGITDEMLLNAPAFGQVAGNIIEMFRGSVLVAHNVGFDIKHLQCEFSQVGLEWPEDVVSIDTVELAKDRWPAMSSHKLGIVWSALNKGQVLENWHSAMADVYACANILKHADPYPISGAEWVSWPVVEHTPGFAVGRP